MGPAPNRSQNPGFAGSNRPSIRHRSVQVRDESPRMSLTAHVDASIVTAQCPMSQLVVHSDAEPSSLPGE